MQRVRLGAWLRYWIATRHSARERNVSIRIDSASTANAHADVATCDPLKNSRWIASTTIQTLVTASRPVWTNAERCSTLPCPKGCSGSAGLSARRTDV